MHSFNSRRYRNTGGLLLAIVVALTTAALSRMMLRDTPELSGWTLLTLVVFLTLYNIRKKLAFLPLGSSACWLQIHIYTGLFTGLLFGIHLGWRMPSGMFEIVLATLYGTVFISGVLGLLLSRSFARRLTTRGEEVIYERISERRRRLQIEVEEILLQCLEKTDSSIISQCYNEHLQPFFQGVKNFFPHLVESHRPQNALLAAIQSQSRFLNDTEREAMQAITIHVKTKNELDYQFALQATLKYWMFVHVPLTYALLVFAAFHLVLVKAFSGGAL